MIKTDYMNLHRKHPVNYVYGLPMSISKFGKIKNYWHDE